MHHTHGRIAQIHLGLPQKSTQTPRMSTNSSPYQDRAPITCATSLLIHLPTYSTIPYLISCSFGVSQDHPRLYQKSSVMSRITSPSAPLTLRNIWTHTLNPTPGSSLMTLYPSLPHSPNPLTSIRNTPYLIPSHIAHPRSCLHQSRIFPGAPDVQTHPSSSIPLPNDFLSYLSVSYSFPFILQQSVTLPHALEHPPIIFRSQPPCPDTRRSFLTSARSQPSYLLSYLGSFPIRNSSILVPQYLEIFRYPFGTTRSASA